MHSAGQTLQPYNHLQYVGQALQPDEHLHYAGQALQSDRHLQYAGQVSATEVGLKKWEWRGGKLRVCVERVSNIQSRISFDYIGDRKTAGVSLERAGATDAVELEFTTERTAAPPAATIEVIPRFTIPAGKVIVG